MSGPRGTSAWRSASRYLAFLADDCLARPGWVTGGLLLHHAGAQAVATAVVGEGDARLLALPANRLCYASRHPAADPRHLSFYGQSYARTLLRQLGHFPPGLRVGENTALNQPFSLAQDLLSRDTSLVRAVRRAVPAVQWLATQAERHGTLQGLAQIARAEGLAVQARAAADPGLALQACTLDPQDAEKAVLQADLLRHSADLPGARADFATAPAVDPAHPAGAEGLVAVVSALDGPSAASGSSRPRHPWPPTTPPGPRAWAKWRWRAGSMLPQAMPCSPACTRPQLTRWRKATATHTACAPARRRRAAGRRSRVRKAKPADCAQWPKGRLWKGVWASPPPQQDHSRCKQVLIAGERHL